MKKIIKRHWKIWSKLSVYATAFSASRAFYGDKRYGNYNATKHFVYKKLDKLFHWILKK